MSDNSGCGCIIFLIILYMIFNFIIQILSKIFTFAVSALALILMTIIVAGMVVGLFNSFKCFFKACFEVIDNSKLKSKQILYSPGHAPRNDEGEYKYFEEYAPASYFNGQFSKDFFSIASKTWGNIFEKISDAAEAIKFSNSKVISVIKNVATIIFLFAFGIVSSIIVLALMSVLCILILLVYRLFYMICIGFDNIYYSVKKISRRCDNCNKVYKLPVYVCPNCGVPHLSLRPGKFGVLKRRCVCGYVLPCFQKGKTKDNLSRKELEAFCPYCRKSDKSKDSRPLGIALIGGTSAGKTTFKTAFLYEFVNDYSLRYGIDVSFLSEREEKDFAEIEKCFKGIRMVNETKGSSDHDVIPFDFFMKHKNFDVPRLVHLYDMPGEVFETNNAKERLEHFTFSEGVIFIIDPYTLESVMNDGEKHGSMRVGKMSMERLVEVFLNTVSSLQNMPKSGGKYTLPVAVAINKVDSARLKNLIGTPAINKLMKEKPEIYKNRFDTMDYICRAFLSSNDQNNVVDLLDRNFKNVHFFSCSSMGYVPDAKLIRFMPENVTAAVHWILARSDNSINSIWKDLEINDISESQKAIWKANARDYSLVILNEKS